MYKAAKTNTLDTETDDRTRPSETHKHYDTFQIMCPKRPLQGHPGGQRLSPIRVNMSIQFIDLCTHLKPIIAEKEPIFRQIKTN